MARKKVKRRNPYKKGGNHRCGWDLGQVARPVVGLAATAIGLSALKQVSS